MFLNSSEEFEGVLEDFFFRPVSRGSLLRESSEEGKDLGDFGPVFSLRLYAVRASD